MLSGVHRELSMILKEIRVITDKIKEIHLYRLSLLIIHPNNNPNTRTILRPKKSDEVGENFI